MNWGVTNLTVNLKIFVRNEVFDLQHIFTSGIIGVEVSGYFYINNWIFYVMLSYTT